LSRDYYYLNKAIEFIMLKNNGDRNFLEVAECLKEMGFIQIYHE
jgi:hypothetical protein